MDSFGPIRVLIPKHMECAVDREANKLLVGIDALFRSLPEGLIYTDINIPKWGIRGIVEVERDNICDIVPSQIPGIHLPNLRIVEEGQGDLGFTHPFLDQGLSYGVLHLRRVDR